MGSVITKVADPQVWADSAGFYGLVTLAIFLLFALVLLIMERRLNAIPLQIQKAKSEIIAKLYEAGILAERRKNARAKKNKSAQEQEEE